MKRGGHLAIHADFNPHVKLKLRRRLNLLIYLNEDWEERFGGDLELWDKKMEKCEVKISPIFNRAVLFNTDSDTFHGNPEPLDCPPKRSRRSLGFYYYTTSDAIFEEYEWHSTDFKARKGTQNKVDFKMKVTNFIRDFPQ